MASNHPTASLPFTGPQAKNCFQIHALPQEVLMAVFDFALVSFLFDPSEYCDQRTELRLVCKRWDEFILDIPGLWALCSTDLPHQTNEVSIFRSRQHPLVIRADIEFAMPEWWNLITPHLCR